ncbi:hypothetical protein [Pseudomonas sp. LB3P14]
MNIFKEALLMHIASAIDFRESKSLKHPDDARNLASGVALEGAAETVKALPGDHPLFAKLALVNESTCERWNELENRFISRWGFFNEITPADSGFRFVAELSESADEYLAEQAMNELISEFAGKLTSYFDDQFAEEFKGRLWGIFDGKLTEEYMDELTEEFRDGLVEKFARELANWFGDKYVGGMDEVVHEYMSQHADKIRGELAEEFIRQMGDKLWE